MHDEMKEILTWHHRALRALRESQDSFAKAVEAVSVTAAALAAAHQANTLAIEAMLHANEATVRLLESQQDN